MAVTDPTADDRAAVPGGSRWRRHPRAFAVAAALVAAVVAVAAVVFVHWRDGLRLFFPLANGIGQVHLVVGRTMYVGGMVVPSAGNHGVTVRVTSIRPVVTADTAHASVRVLLCTVAPGQDTDFLSAYSLTGACSRVAPFTPGTLTFSSRPKAGTIAAIVAVTPRTSGHVHVAGVDVSYQQGFRRGDQRTGMAIDTRSPRS